MQTASGLPIRKRIRLRNFDYGGVHTYYVTINAFEKQCLFGTCDGENVVLNDLGLLVQSSWRDTATIRPDVILDEFIVMPNHMHALICLTSKTEQKPKPMKRVLGRVIGGFKSQVTGDWRERICDQAFEIWQIRFHDHVVRKNEDLDRIRAYIHNNPARWRPS